MDVVVVGAGPAGLLFAARHAERVPHDRVVVHERASRERAQGLGIVVGEEALDALALRDPWLGALVARSSVGWDAIETVRGAERWTVPGFPLRGLSRALLLEALTERAERAGVAMHFGSEWKGAATPEALLVGADGVNSAVRSHARLDAPLREGPTLHLWLALEGALPHFQFHFGEVAGHAVALHAYPHGREASTVVVELPREAHEALGLGAEGIEPLRALLEQAFPGRSIQRPDGVAWRRFRTRSLGPLVAGRTVLLGDAAHTAHFSIGSGTRLALEDALSLDAQLAAQPTVEAALAAHEEARRRPVASLQRAARESERWFEALPAHTSRPMAALVGSLLSRSLRVGLEGLAARDGRLRPARMPLAESFEVGGLVLVNRVVVAPMATYRAQAGLPGEFHAAHLGALVRGGAGLVLTEMTAVEPEGRITPACTGLWSDAQLAAWRSLVAFVHAAGGARIGLQLGHAGRRGSTRVPREVEGRDDVPLTQEEGAWETCAASPLPWCAGMPTPRALDEEGMARIQAAFVAAALRAGQAGFDLLELHLAHGYLLSGFLSPLSNRRGDGFGGDAARRARFPLAVVEAVRAVWRGPLSVRFSAREWHPEGMGAAQVLAFARGLKERGVDLLHVSSGQTTPLAAPPHGRAWQLHLSEWLRREVGLPTIAVGALSTAEDVNSALAFGRADLVALGRAHLADPQWTKRALSGG